MPNIRVCALFRPPNSKEKSDHGDSVTIRGIDSESFIFKGVLEGSEQAHIYEFLALPIVKGVVNGVNGAIITFGQTGAGKTYSMEGPSITECDEKQKGLLPRVVDGLFNAIKLSDDMTKYTIKLSMVEIYMERVRDLFDLSKDNLQIKESKVQGIFVSGVTELARLCLVDHYAEWNSKQSCGRNPYGKLILVDLAGSEKAEKTGAEGKVLEEAKTINKSLSALGNGGSSQTALLCCCSPSPSNASESLSTLRFGASTSGAPSLTKNESCDRILQKLSQRMKAEDVQLLEELFILEGIFFDPNSVEEVESAYKDVTSTTISSLQKAVEDLITTVDEVRPTNLNESMLLCRIKKMKTEKLQQAL
ncbi:hypothetical protein DH2020_002879 [Rehmannia glutinosa]|uniref:Kinesin-like protein n=1 Tax=Rehmannia glutinosa TaxID=99300 RepID=A0ABR0XUZ7_REHGL